MHNMSEEFPNLIIGCLALPQNNSSGQQLCTEQKRKKKKIKATENLRKGPEDMEDVLWCTCGCGVSWGPAGSSLAPGARSGRPLPHFPAGDHGWTRQHTLPLAQAFTYTSRIGIFRCVYGSPTGTFFIVPGGVKDLAFR